ncbi:unnamed protein product, partial [Mesorhabditis belari]|uniref:Ground-like domain-containing protein n=1 Tax=Mesorhabditis belari TaxID=2138241 RepID=A0AAF3FLQ3_9BILA
MNLIFEIIGIFLLSTIEAQFGCGGGCSSGCGAPLPMPCARPCSQPQPCPMQVCPPPPICPPPPPPPQCPPPMCAPRFCPPPPTPMCPRPACPMAPPCPCGSQSMYQPQMYGGGFGFGFGMGFGGGCSGGGGCGQSRPYLPPPAPTGGCGASPPAPSGCGGAPPPPVPAQNDCCCGCKGTCKYRRRKAFGAKTRMIDPSCNSAELRTIIQKYITMDTSESKRQIQKAAQSVFGSRVNVICGRGEYSYIAHTDLFCQTTKGEITCYAFKPL